MNSLKQCTLRTLLGVTAVASLLLSPVTAHAAAGDIYEADAGSNTIYKFTPAGTKVAFATGLNSPAGLAFDQAGNLYAADRGSGSIFKFTPAGQKSTFATGLQNPGFLAFDAAGNLFVPEHIKSEAVNNVVKITPAGTKTVFASGLYGPSGLAFDSAGNLFVADGSVNSAPAIYKYTPSGTRSTFAAGKIGGFPRGLAFDGNGNLYLADAHSVQKFTPDGTQSTYATINGDDGPAALVFDAANNLFVSVPTVFKNDTIFKYSPDRQGVNFATGMSYPNSLAIEPPRGKPINIATRLNVQTGENVLIGGFIITGTGGKSVVIRGIGPSLSALGVQGALQDPILELHYPGGGFFNTNDNWKDTQASQIQATGLAPTDDREAAFSYNLPPGNYTVVMKGKNGGTGIGLIEVYDVDQANGKLANISTRGQVGTGGNVMIGGFILGANGARVIVRGLGPSLTNAGIAGALSDPRLSLRDSNGTEIAANNNWTDSQAAEIQATGVAPSNDFESAIVATLPNGNYTAILEGVSGATGVGLVEVYNLQ
jgi:sugar lactone lactonase YvrE